MELVIVLLVLFVAFFLQSVIGFASALIAAPFLVLFLSFPEMVVLLNFIGLFFAAYQVPRVYLLSDKRMLVFLLPALLVGMFVGVRSLRVVSRGFLEGVLLVVIVLGLLMIIFRSRIRLPASAGVLVGLLGGFFSGSVGVGGPVYAPYVDLQASSSVIARATLIVLFALIDLFKLPLLFSYGFVSSSIVLTALFSIPIIWLAMVLGNKASGLVPQKVYHASVFVLVLIAATLLVV